MTEPAVKDSEMQKFRKKPVVIEAVRWDESMRTLELLRSHGLIAGGFTGHEQRPDECCNLRVHTLEGSMRAEKGDWIIRGIKGEFYPCKPDIFAAIYEAVEPETAR